ncbi:single-stranded DNA-binding protein [Bailinhaonella thermotolerans]|uniref:single-stranded DNA-binding protein n=1 Tax=Bailinhaonella thermotolerans TaxID=1070861 RepID=UPI00192A6361|nr:single-stranded DNA-binding protein [Bailinhaonella thermotolerans]
MRETYTTVVGNVVAEPRVFDLGDGNCVLSVRLASTPRVYDRSAQTWRDGQTLFLTVRCWRALAANVAQSIKIGDPLLVHGRLAVREWDSNGVRKTSVEVEANSVGHDLNRGVTRFTKSIRRAAPDPETDRRLKDSTEDWATGVGPGHASPGAVPAGSGPGPAPGETAPGGTVAAGTVAGGIAPADPEAATLWAPGEEDERPRAA